MEDSLNNRLISVFHARYYDDDIGKEAISVLGDLNDDGIDNEIIVGCHKCNEASGALYVLLLNEDGEVEDYNYILSDDIEHLGYGKEMSV